MNRIAYILVPVLFFIGLLFNSFAYYAKVVFALNTWINDLILLSILILSLHTIFRSARLDSIGITQKLRLILILILMIYLVSLALVSAVQPEFITPRYAGGYVFKPNSWSAMVTANIIGAVAIISLTLCFHLIRSLIYYRQKKNTHFYFLFMVLSGAVTIILATLSGKPLKYDLGYNFILTSVGLMVTTLFMIPNVFRVGWVTVLNRKQKFFTFIGGIVFVLVTAGLFGAEVGGGLTYADMVNSYSILAGSFLMLMTIFMLLYSLATTINVLMHLPTAAIYDKKVREINSIYSLSRAITTVFDFDRIARSVTELAADATNAQACWIDTATSKSPALSRPMQLLALKIKPPLKIPYLERKLENRGQTESYPEAIDRDVVEATLSAIMDEILKNKKPLVINQARREKLSRHLKKTGIESLMVVPMLSYEEVIGIIYVAKAIPFGFDQEDVAIVSALANQATVAIENTRLVKESLERERLAEELRIAHEVQMRLIPQTVPAVMNAEKTFSVGIGAVTVPALEVGGDYYDFMKLPANHTGIVVADVSGKGTSAAFYMAEIKGIIQALGAQYTSPKELLGAVNQVLYHSIDRKTFITLIWADIDIDRQEVRVARAGHCPLLYLHGNKAEFLLSDGIGLGLDPGPIFRKSITELCLPLQPEDVFVLYSDGLMEARNAIGDEYGEQRLSEIVLRNRHLSAESIKDTIIADVSAFVGTMKSHDDLTCVVFKVNAVSAVNTQSLPAAAAQDVTANPIG